MSTTPPKTLQDIEWTTWTPVDRATLLFVIRGEEILLIHKKRGLGAGKINGPGGRIDGDETPRECAIREVQEELCVTPTTPTLCGEHRFQFVDGYSIHVHVFRSDDCIGEAQETDEAIPLWTPLTEIPYDKMWADDELWVPHLLEGRKFQGDWLFDGDQMLDHRLDVVAQTPKDSP